MRNAPDIYCSLVNLDDMSPSEALAIFNSGGMKLLPIPAPVNTTAINSKETLAVGPELLSLTLLPRLELTPIC
jgi:hypothetical protein